MTEPQFKHIVERLDAIQATLGGLYLNVDQAAEIKNVHPKTILAWIHSGKLPAVKKGRYYKIKISDL